MVRWFRSRNRLVSSREKVADARGQGAPPPFRVRTSERIGFLNIKQVKYFVSVAEHRSLSAAAREQGVSVQAISKAMKDFEQELPAALLVRRNDGVDLTPFGEEFYPRARSVWEAFHELEMMTAESVRQNRPLRVLLCSPVFWHSKRASASMEAFFLKSLGMEAKVSFGGGEDGLEALRVGACDVMITIGTLNRPEFDCFAVGTVPTGICVAKNHPLAARDEVAPEDIVAFPAISSKTFDHFNESILVRYQKKHPDIDVVEPDPTDLLALADLFYRKHGMCLMAKVPSLGEMFPGSVMVPFANRREEAIPLCLISPHRAKTIAYLQLEKLLKDRNLARAL